MRRIFWLLALSLSVIKTEAQITVTAADMPVAGDTLRYSTASMLTLAVHLADSGANVNWDYSSLTSFAQAVDTFKSATSVNALYAFTLPSAYGYKVADSIPGVSLLLPVSVDNIYSFFQMGSNPSSYAAVSFGAQLSGFPIPAKYTDKDTWYFFPLSYGNHDSSDFLLNISLPTVGGIKRQGYRKSRVDGWGKITTPYTSAPVSCIRIRSQVHEVDSVTYSGRSIGIPLNTVEYKWLANGEHYPLLWVTTTVIAGVEVISNIRFRDNPRGLARDTTGSQTSFEAYPVPAADGMVQLRLPAGWDHFHVDVFTMSAASVLSGDDTKTLDLHAVPSGQYIARVISGGHIAYAKLLR